jgi:hypothetical protein
MIVTTKNGATVEILGLDEPGEVRGHIVMHPTYMTRLRAIMFDGYVIGDPNAPQTVVDAFNDCRKPMGVMTTDTSIMTGIYSQWADFTERFPAIAEKLKTLDQGAAS